MVRLFDFIEVDTIKKYFQNVESIAMRYSMEESNWDEKVATLVKFSKLKKLELDIWSAPRILPLLKILGQCSTLETLTLRKGKLDAESNNELSKLEQLRTLKLVKRKLGEVTANSLLVLVGKMQLMHLHIIQCHGVYYEDIAKAIAHSKTLQSVTFVAIEEEPVYLEKEQLLLLENARMASDVDFPLQFFQAEAAFDAQLPASRFIELKKVNSTETYSFY